MTAWRILEGKVMYRDFYYAQAPLWGYLVALMYALFGIGLFQGRIIMVLWSGVTVLVIFFSGARKANTKTGLIGGLIFTIHPLAIRYGTLILNDFPAITLVLIAYYLLHGAYETVIQTTSRTETENDYWDAYTKTILAGICLGIGVSIKLIVAPIIVGLIIVLLVEGHVDSIDQKAEVKQIGFLVLGFVTTVGVVFTFFLLVAKDAFIFQILGQHLSKTPHLGQTWLSRIGYPLSRIWNVDKPILLILLISIPFALKTRYGRGLIVIIITSIISIILLVPRPHLNYYDMQLPIVAMICGFFPLSPSVLFNLRSKFRFNRKNLLQVLGWIFIVSYIIYLVFSPAQVRPMLEEPIKAVNWVKANTKPDEYILSDNTNINIMSERRGPFAEISIDRMDLGRLTSDMLIQSLYDYQIRVVVVTGRQFGRYDAFDDFMEFLEENYAIIEAGFLIYVRNLPLNEILM